MPFENEFSDFYAAFDALVDAHRWAGDEAVGTGSGEVMAGVLLSCWNSDRFPLQVHNLLRLDAERLRLAMGVIRALAHHRIESHKAFSDEIGSQTLLDLAEYYGIEDAWSDGAVASAEEKALSVNCPHCGTKRTIFVEPGTYVPPQIVKCEAARGGCERDFVVYLYMAVDVGVRRVSAMGADARDAEVIS